MTTVVELESPADRLGLSETFDHLPAFELQIAGLIGASPPLVWVSGPDRHAVEARLEADPTVDVIASLADTSDDRWLFRLEFGEELEEFQRIVSENDGAVLEASASGGMWSLKLLFHDRSALSGAHSVFEEQEYQISVKRVTSLDEPSGGASPLTTTQYETIVKANELGYFDVPRKVTLQELAAELDVSHQALSERLRRSHAALVSEELSNRMTPAGIDS